MKQKRFHSVISNVVRAIIFSGFFAMVVFAGDLIMSKKHNDKYIKKKNKMRTPSTQQFGDLDDVDDDSNVIDDDSGIQNRIRRKYIDEYEKIVDSVGDTTHNIIENISHGVEKHTSNGENGIVNQTINKIAKQVKNAQEEQVEKTTEQFCQQVCQQICKDVEE